MHVVATAGHVDHGKSTLVKALTGSDPDRLEEEHRRGLTIELGYCWTALPPVGDVAFVDVPGHERFVATMLSGVGPVPAVLLVVAADDPWMPQAAEHLAALDALGVAHGVVAVTRADLADPGPAAARAQAEVGRTSLAGSPVVPVSARTGEGLDALRAALAAMLQRLPTPDPDADVRLWVDRRFHVRGAGTVVTGTLPAGTVRRGDLLEHDGRTVRVRGVESLGTTVDEARGVARVALNLAGESPGGLDRGDPLLTPGAWHLTTTVDVRLRGPADVRLPERPLLHIGATAVGTRARPLDDGLVRLALDRPLPLRIGDRALLRDPGSRAVWGLTVLDPAPSPLERRRGAAARRAAALAGHDGTPDLAAEVRRRGLVPADLLRRVGVPVSGAAVPGAAVPGAAVPGAAVSGAAGPADRDSVAGAPAPEGMITAGGWLMSADRAGQAATDLERLVREHDAADPLHPGVPVPELAERLGLPTPELVAPLVRPPLRVDAGRVTAVAAAAVPEPLAHAVETLHQDLADAPWSAPTADRLAALRLDAKAVAALAKAGLLLRVAPGIVLLPDAADRARDALAELPQPFTASEARQRLGTSRRVVLPLLDHLDRTGRTRRLPDDRREVVPR